MGFLQNSELEIMFFKELTFLFINCQASIAKCLQSPWTKYSALFIVLKTENFQAESVFSYNILAEEPGIARGKKILKIFFFEKHFFGFFLAYITPRPPMSDHKKFQLNRSSRLAGYREHKYDCLVLL